MRTNRLTVRQTDKRRDRQTNGRKDKKIKRTEGQKAMKNRRQIYRKTDNKTNIVLWATVGQRSKRTDRP